MSRSNVASELRDLLTVFVEHRSEQRAELADRSTPPATSPADEGQVLSELVNKLRSRQGISVPTDG